MRPVLRCASQRARRDRRAVRGLGVVGRLGTRGERRMALLLLVRTRMVRKANRMAVGAGDAVNTVTSAILMKLARIGQRSRGGAAHLRRYR